MNVFFGVSASPGLCVGKTFVIPDAQQRVIPKEALPAGSKEEQWLRFEDSLGLVSAKMSRCLADASSRGDKTEAALYETYTLMLGDPVFVGQVKSEFLESEYNIEFVLNKRIEEDAEKLRASGNEYLAERANDITDVFGKVLDDMLGFRPFQMEEVPEGAVIVATSLAVPDVMAVLRRKPAGFALTEGGVSSHVAILARTYGIPAVFGLSNITKRVSTGESIIIDAEKAEVIIGATEQEAAGYIEKIAERKERSRRLAQFRERPALTKDGKRIFIYANIGSLDEARAALGEGADGIGLFRTEFLCMDDKPFSEEAQFEVYRDVLKVMDGRPVTIRTLDAGGDKIVRSADFPLAEEKNPLLGLRAIRLSLAYPQQLRVQLRALYRASVYGNLRIMFPLITDAAQILAAKDLAAEVQAELESERIDFKRDVPLGIMVETAAAAVMADEFARMCDFFSIGTNDLTQYTIGVDRENPAVSKLYDELHPAVLRLIRSTLDAAKSAGIAVSVCGEMASRPESAAVLAGMGVESLSMSATQISAIKEALSSRTSAEFRAAAEDRLRGL